MAQLVRLKVLRSARRVLVEEERELVGTIEGLRTRINYELDTNADLLVDSEADTS